MQFKRGWHVKFGKFVRAANLCIMSIYSNVRKITTCTYGYTTDLRKRFKKHNDEENKSTKPFRLYKLIYYEASLDRYKRCQS